MIHSTFVESLKRLYNKNSETVTFEEINRLHSLGKINKKERDYILENNIG